MSAPSEAPVAPWLAWCRRILTPRHSPPPEPTPEPRRLPWYGQVDLPTTHG